MVRTLGLAATLVALLIAACGDDDDENVDDATPSPTATASADDPTVPTESPELTPTTAATKTAAPTPSNTVEDAIVTYATTTGLDIPREMSEPLYCVDLGDDDVEPNIGKVCILGTSPAGAGAVPGTPVSVEAGITFSDGVWMLTVEVVDGAWAVTSSEPSNDGL